MKYIATMEVEPIDPAIYVRPPVMTLESGITLCRTLVKECPKTMPASVKNAAKKLNGAADKAQAALAKRQKALGKISDEDVRLIDQEGDVSWGSLRSRLVGYAGLPANEYPDATRAGDLITILFGSAGLSFLKETYPVQWSTADTILGRIDDDGLQKDIDRIAGKEFLENIRKRHAAYGAMVKRLLARDSTSTVNLSNEVRELGRAIVTYATQVCASVDDENVDSISAARTALHPLDVFREASVRKAPAESGTGDPAAEPAAEPSPEK